MRIRKRAVPLPLPLPLSSLCPIPHSSSPADRHLLSRSPVVQLQPLHNSNNNDPPQESQKGSSFDRRQSHNQQIGGENNKYHSVLLEKDEKGMEGDTSCNGPSAKMDLSLSLQQSSSPNNREKDKRMKTKMNKKCAQKNGSEGVQEDNKKEVKAGGISSSGSVIRKRRRSGALMEGSRCSRVNGRGWRCCQQTLVGYSLCEHHLGKGRLKSMTNVRSQRTSASTKTKKAGSLQPLSSHSSFSSVGEKEARHVVSDIGDEEEEEEGGEDDDGMNKRLVIATRKTKIGMFKARSMSSLLGQANGVIRVEEKNK